MAAVTMLTMLGGIGLKASAAGEQTAVYIVEFPRSGDANSGANWGNSTMNFMNGWSMPALRTLHMRAIGSYTGQVCYCVEPGNSQHSGDRFTSRDDSYWDNFPSNGSLSGDEIKMFIGRNGALSFKDYTLTDVTIKSEEGTLTHNIRTECQTSYNIVVEYKNGSADYFKTIIENEKIDRVVLVARKDKFSNCIFFNLKKYGGMNIIDSFGRDVVLSKYGEQFIWKLPSAEGENPITIKYQTNSQNSTLESYTDAENRTTTYLYTDKDVYSAQSKCVSKQYGDDSDVKIPWLLLKEIIHPTKAKTPVSF